MSVFSKLYIVEILMGLCSSVLAESYYVDSRLGVDSNSGTSGDAPWQSLDKLNAQMFSPGDHIFLKAGSEFAGQFKPQGSGMEAAPVVLSAYGDGEMPRIDGGGVLPSAVWLHNVEYWQVCDIEVTNEGPEREPGRYGVLVSIDDFGTAHEIVLRNLYVHDVNGSLSKRNAGSAGIFWRNAGADTPSWFDGLRIENCRLARTDRDGIKGRSDFFQRDNWYPSRNVVIRGNLLEDIGGDGIVPYGCVGALVEHNVIRGGRMRTKEHAAGIWPWSCDDTVIQFNEVSGYKGYVDGQGFDCDFNCRNTLIQYNYSHDNEGGFVLLCNAKGTQPTNIGNLNPVVRYNISQNDGMPEQGDGRGPIFTFSGTVTNPRIYNNTVYVDAKSKADTELFMVNAWGSDKIGWADNVWFANNIFMVTGKATFNLGEITRVSFENNVYAGEFINRPEDLFAVMKDPQFVAPGTGDDGKDSLSGYQLMPTSPARSVGRLIPDSGGRDFSGALLSSGKIPTAGAFE